MTRTVTCRWCAKTHVVASLRESCGSCQHADDPTPTLRTVRCAKPGGFYEGRLMQQTSLYAAWSPA